MMSSWNTKLIDAYRCVSWPYRRYRYAQLQKAGEVPVIALYYHRVADTHPNDWTISRQEFERQIDWFEERFDIVSLEECQRRISSGRNTRPTLSITFDDGYAENCEFALPMLIERKIPVTYFVTTEHTIGQRPFPHDIACKSPLPTNTLESLRALDMAGVEIGGHTKSHADLGKIHDDETLTQEVIGGIRELEAAIGRKVRFFAFPYGQYRNLNAKVFQMLKAEGLLGVCSAYGGWNQVGDDPFHIQRIHGDKNFARMRNWLSFDPRLAKTTRYEYEASEGEANGSQRGETP